MSLIVAGVPERRIRASWSQPQVCSSCRIPLVRGGMSCYANDISYDLLKQFFCSYQSVDRFLVLIRTGLTEMGLCP